MNKHNLSEILSRISENKPITKDELVYARAAQSQLGRQNFESFCIQMRPKYKWAWFHKVIMRENNTIFEQGYGRLELKMPDQHGKSEILGRLAVAYLLGKYPTKRILYCTYSDERAKTPAAEIIDILISKEYQQTFPEFKLLDDLEQGIRLAKRRREKLGVLHFTNANSPEGEHKGSFTGAGIESGVVGFSYDIIILDDLFNGIKEAKSPVIRETRWEIFVNNILSRQQKDTIILLFGTWWHSDDIMGTLKKVIQQAKEEGKPYVPWVNLEFNALKDDRDYPYDHRKKGEYLWPEYKMNYYLDTQLMSPAMWSIKCQNIPMDKLGKVFTPIDFRWYDDRPKDLRRIHISVDPNNGNPDKQTDDCAVAVQGFGQQRCYLLEMKYLNEMDTMRQVSAIYQLTLKYPNYSYVLLENSGNGQTLKAELKKLGIRIKMFDVKSFDNDKLKMGGAGKLERAYNVQCFFQNGQYYLPSHKICQDDPSFDYKAILKTYEQFLGFTGQDGAKDDGVDANVQGLIASKPFFEPVRLSERSYNIPLETHVPQVSNKVQHSKFSIPHPFNIPKTNNKNGFFIPLNTGIRR